MTFCKACESITEGPNFCTDCGANLKSQTNVFLVKAVKFSQSNRWEHDALLGVFSDFLKAQTCALRNKRTDNDNIIITRFDVDGDPDSEILISQL